MGGSISTMKSSKLTKPDDCSQDNWHQILILFDKLDSDGTRSIEVEELMGHIAVLHVNNNIKQLNEKKISFLCDTEFQKNQIQSDLEINIEKMRKEAEYNIKCLEQTNAEYITTIKESIQTLNDMTIDEKGQKIRQVICGEKTSIEFWDFYKYMKTRTNDIPNIIW
uniref:EF-hand domain-containing protein n=1 Tax=viral metagenome TaxID=1070528 RepID=A0A6C0C333_9ZZZZ